MSDATEAPDGTVDVDESPTRTGAAVGAAAGVGAVLALGVAAPASLAFGVPGVVAVVAGTRRGSRRAVDGGALLAALGIVLAGAVGGGVLPVLLATVCLALAWDGAETAVANGRQVPGATTGPSERTHLAATGGLLAVAGGVAFAVYRIATGGLPTSALLALLVGGGVLVLAIRPGRDGDGERAS